MFINLFKIFIFSNRNKNYSPLRNYQFFFLVCKEAYLLKIYLEVFIKCVCVTMCVLAHAQGCMYISKCVQVCVWVHVHMCVHKYGRYWFIRSQCLVSSSTFLHLPIWSSMISGTSLWVLPTNARITDVCCHPWCLHVSWNV